MNRHTQLLRAVGLAVALIASPLTAQSQKTLVDFFLPIPAGAPLVGEGETWGDTSVLPRDTTNGLEDGSMKNWCYWDGKIVKDDVGKYHMYASRWSQTFHHGVGWTKGSKGVHAVSDHLLGKYVDQGEIWSDWNDGKGHNVVGVRLKDGRYAAMTSEITRGEIFVSDTPDGDFSFLGEIEIDDNGYYPGWTRYNELDLGAVRGNGVGKMANVTIFERHDGRYMIISRHCVPLISDNGVLGPYKALGDRAWWGVEGVPQFLMEDPTMWYSDGLYHIVVNHYRGDHTYHLTSEDGIHNWRNRGAAFSHAKGVFKYTDGTINNWYTVQRPTAYVEDGHIMAFNFSVIDVHKGADLDNDNHGSKIVVVPFDHEAFGKHITDIIEQEHEEYARTPLPQPWQFVLIGKVAHPATCGYEADTHTQRLMTCGNEIAGNKDALPFVYQEMRGDISLSTLVMYQDLTKEAVETGLMLRSSLEPDAATYMATLSNDKGLTAYQRNSVGKKITQVLAEKEIKAPYYLRIEKRGDKVQLHISPSNRYNWTMVSEVTVPLGETFYVGTTATNDTNDRLTLARLKESDAHVWGEPTREGIVSHTFPDTIPTSGKITFELTHEDIQPLDFYVELECIETGERYPSMRKESPWQSKGTYTLTYDAGKPLAPNTAYWVCIKAVPFHFHDSEAVQSTFKRVVTK